MSHLKLSTIFVLTVACYYLGVVDAVCPFGWIHDGSYCYGFGTTPMTWAEALAVCQGYGGTLAEPRTSQINQRIKFHLRRRKITSPVWIGGNDFFREDNFKWVNDPSEMAWSNFHNGQPDNYKGQEDCVEMGERWQYQWNDFDCRGRKYFVCQRRH